MFLTFYYHYQVKYYIDQLIIEDNYLFLPNYGDFNV